MCSELIFFNKPNIGRNILKCSFRFYFKMSHYFKCKSKMCFKALWTEYIKTKYFHSKNEYTWGVREVGFWSFSLIHTKCLPDLRCRLSIPVIQFETSSLHQPLKLWNPNKVLETVLYNTFGVNYLKNKAPICCRECVFSFWPFNVYSSFKCASMVKIKTKF